MLEELLLYLTHKCFKTVKLWICFVKTAWRKGWRGGLEVKKGGGGADQGAGYFQRAAFQP